MEVIDLSTNISGIGNAYKHIRDWYQNNLEILAQQDSDSRYQEFSRIAIQALPDPQQVTEADLAWVVTHVRSMLLEWGNPLADDAGVEMIQYALEIEKSIVTDMSIQELGQQSRLELIYQDYLKGN